MGGWVGVILVVDNGLILENGLGGMYLTWVGTKSTLAKRGVAGEFCVVQFRNLYWSWGGD